MSLRKITVPTRWARWASVSSRGVEARRCPIAAKGLQFCPLAAGRGGGGGGRPLSAASAALGAARRLDGDQQARKRTLASGGNATYRSVVKWKYVLCPTPAKQSVLWQEVGETAAAAAAATAKRNDLNDGRMEGGLPLAGSW